MMKDSCLKKFEKALSIAKVTFTKEDNFSKLHFNDYSNPQVFSLDLDNLQTDFSNEFLSNLSGLKTTKSKSDYLEYVKQFFVASIEKLGNNPTFLIPNSHLASSIDMEPPCISTQAINVPVLFSYLNIQKNIIIKTIQYVERNFLLIRDEQSKIDDFASYWKNFKIDFFPYISRFKNELSNVTSLPEKIKQVNVIREKIADELSIKGIDLYDSPLNVYFEACLFSLKDSYLSFLDNPNLMKKALQWKAQTVDFLELVLALDQLRCFSFKDGSPVSRKELISQLSAFFNIGPISNYESRLHKFKTRTNKTPFLDKLTKVFRLYTNGYKAK